MKILSLSTYDNIGGAARATYRLHQGFKRIGINNTLLVHHKTNDDYTVIGPRNKFQKIVSAVSPSLDLIPIYAYRSRKTNTFSTSWVPGYLPGLIYKNTFDIIHLHWITAGYIRIEALSKIQKPIVWTLHDMWAFTGGCHYAGSCKKYHHSCGQCPQLGSDSKSDLSSWIWKRKQKTFKSLKLSVVADSEWLADCARKSSLFRDVDIRAIHYGLDTKQYKAIDKRIAKDILSLPNDKIIILFGAILSTSDKRKGFKYLLKAVQSLSLGDDKAEIVIFGAGKPLVPPEFGYKTRYIGHLFDDISMSIVYASADVMVVPSLQEAFGQTAMEAMACGTPVVAFEVGGIVEQIDHKENGYLAKAFETEDLARGILWITENDDRHKKLSKMARKKVENTFTLTKQAHAYEELYNDIMYRYQNKEV
jgi:glycosyltransferase involved in cell wall biosynthesis